MYQPSKEEFERHRISLPELGTEAYSALCKAFTAARPRVVSREWGGFTYKPEPIAMEGHLPGGVARATLTNEWGKSWHTS